MQGGASALRNTALVEVLYTSVSEVSRTGRVAVGGQEDA